MAVSLFAYFFTMITTLSAIAALLIGLSNNSTTESVLHYPRPGKSVIEQTFTSTNPPSRDFPDTPGINKDEPPAKKDGPEKNINDSRVLFAKADTAKQKLEIKNKPDRLAHLNKKYKGSREKPKLLARLRNNYERPNYYGNSLGYAEESRNGPQRLFSNW